MRNVILLAFVAACLLCQTSCGVLGYQANRAKEILRWPLRAELDSRFLGQPPEIDREWVDSKWS